MSATSPQDLTVRNTPRAVYGCAGSCWGGLMCKTQKWAQSFHHFSVKLISYWFHHQPRRHFIAAGLTLIDRWLCCHAICPSACPSMTSFHIYLLMNHTPGFSRLDCKRSRAGYVGTNLYHDIHCYVQFMTQSLDRMDGWALDVFATWRVQPVLARNSCKSYFCIYSDSIKESWHASGRWDPPGMISHANGRLLSHVGHVLPEIPAAVLLVAAGPSKS